MNKPRTPLIQVSHAGCFVRIIIVKRIKSLWGRRSRYDHNQTHKAVNTESETDMTTHEQDMRFYQDNLVKILEDIKADIRHFMFDINANSSESDYACNYIICNVINKYIDKAKAIQSIQNKGV